MLKVNVPAFKFEKAKEYNQMYEEAFEQGERSFEEKLRNARKAKPEIVKDEVKMPSLLKGESSRIKSGKLKPIEEKLAHSRAADKQKHLEGSGNVSPLIFRWSGSTTWLARNSSEWRSLPAVPRG